MPQVFILRDVPVFGQDARVADPDHDPAQLLNGCHLIREPHIIADYPGPEADDLGSFPGPSVYPNVVGNSHPAPLGAQGLHGIPRSLAAKQFARLSFAVSLDFIIRQPKGTEHGLHGVRKLHQRTPVDVKNVSGQRAFTASSFPGKPNDIYV